MVERELHNERSKKINAERKLNEMDIQMNSKRLAGTSNEESQRAQWLKDEIAKKKSQI